MQRFGGGGQSESTAACLCDAALGLRATDWHSVRSGDRPTLRLNRSENQADKLRSSENWRSGGRGAGGGGGAGSQGVSPSDASCRGVRGAQGDAGGPGFHSSTVFLPSVVQIHASCVNVPLTNTP